MFKQIVSDFEHLFPKVQCKLFHLWDIIKEHLIKIYNMEITDSHFKDLVQKYQDKQEDLSDGTLFY